MPRPDPNPVRRRVRGLMRLGFAQRAVFGDIIQMERQADGMTAVVWVGYAETMSTLINRPGCEPFHAECETCKAVTQLMAHLHDSRPQRAV